MKKTIKTLGVAISTAILLFACNMQPTEADLIGKWKLESIDAKKKGLGNMLLSAALSSMKDPIFEFTLDKKVVITSGNSNVSFDHNYEIVDGKIVEKQDNGLTKEVFAVNFSGDTLVLKGAKGLELRLLEAK